MFEGKSVSNQKSALNSILTNSSNIFFAKSLNLFLRIPYIFVIAKVLGPELYGLLVYGQSWYLALLPFSGLGLGSILAVSQSKRDDNARELASLVLAARIVSVSLLFLISITMALYLEAESTTMWLLVLFSFAILGKGASSWAINMFNALEHSKYELRIESIFRPLELLVGIGLVILTKNILLVALSHTLFICLQGYMSCRVLQSKLMPVRAKWEWQKLKSLIMSSSPMAISTPFNQLFLQGPVLLLKRVDAPLSMLGNFSLSMQAFMIINSLFTSVGLSAMPVLSRVQQKSGVLKFARLSIQLSVIIGFGFYLIGSVIIEPVVRWIFASGYENAATHTSVLLLALIPSTCKALLRSILVSQRRLKTIMMIDVIGIGVFVLSFTYLFSLLGFLGAIYALIIGFSASAMISIGCLLQSGELHFTRDVLKPILLLLAGVILYQFVGQYFNNFYQAILTFAGFSLMSMLAVPIPYEQVRRKLLGGTKK
jgi:O-antigen/teichoic acid export membrane protein